MNTVLDKDRHRYADGRMPKFQVFFRKYQNSKGVLKQLYRFLYRIYADKSFIEIPRDTKIGAGLCFHHAFGITMNADTIIGDNCNIHKGVTIGQENRGARKGSPVIGNSVWIGINSTIVGHIVIGDDVLIAPNSYVNCDVPSHSIVVGNPCRIVHNDNATDEYIYRKIN